MLQALINFLLNRKGHPVQKDSSMDAQAPYKVETPVVGKPADDRVEAVTPAGTWPFPSASAEEKKPAVKAKTARTKKAPVAAITAAEKPKKAPAKPRAKKIKE